MKRVKVLIPFYDKEAGVVRKVGEEVDLAEGTIESAKAINVNMLLVLGDSEEKAPKKPRAKKEVKE